MGQQRESNDAFDRQSNLAGGIGRFDTTEVRWFAAGRIPERFVVAFRELPGPVHREVRTDTYLVDGSIDRGVKRRDRGPIEVKSRLPYSGAVDFGEAVSGRVEEWRKVAGRAEALPPGSEGGSWIDVEKIILKRFEEGQPADTGCQTELTSLLVTGTVAWTFALETWGPPEIRRNLLARTIESFGRDLPPALEFAASLRYSMGYPEWIATIAGRTSE